MRNYALSYGREGYGLVLEELPWWSEPLLTLSNEACEITRHHFCHRIHSPVVEFVERHTRVTLTLTLTRNDALRADGTFVADMDNIFNDEGEESPE